LPTASKECSNWRGRRDLPRPLTSLPPGQRAEVERPLERIRALRERGLTIILVEHNMSLVMKVADRVLVMDYGQYLFEGTPAEVQANPAVIAAYLGA
jgi:branched-chain amino acid transport system ATP-binding protein